MSSRFRRALNEKLLHTPPWFIADNLHYEVQMGSVAYGVSNDQSDMDIYGWTIPPKDYVFPHLRGEVPGFGTPDSTFDNWQQHHVKDASARVEYDFSIYSVVRYVHLAMMNNPNILDSLFVPARCILHITTIGGILRDARKEFLHKGAMKKLVAYARGQLNKADTKKQSDPSLHVVWGFEHDHGIPPSVKLDDINHEIEIRSGVKPETPFDPTDLKRLDMAELITYRDLYIEMMNVNKRLDGVKRFGYDPKYLYHVVRLSSSAEQILREGDLDLEEKSRREQMKAVRSGSWSLDDVKIWYTEKEKELEKIRETSTLREEPDEERIKGILMSVLEAHYGSLDHAVKMVGKEERILREIAALVQSYA